MDFFHYASKCKVCQSDCKTLELTRDMPPHLQLYFVDPVKEMKKIMKTLLVQNKHCIMYMEEYVPKLETNFLKTKSLLDKKTSEIDVLKKKIELLLEENELLKREVIHLKQTRTSYSAKEAPITDLQDLFGGGNRSFGARSVGSAENKHLFKPRPQRMTPLAALMKNRCALRDNMRMLKPNTPGGRMNQTFIMSSKSPSFASKGKW
uniref:Uncharacterized protein n=1 Tax=Rhodnius prolixus TaxID=13249 RepID=T1IFK9_RHOPR